MVKYEHRKEYNQRLADEERGFWSKLIRNPKFQFVIALVGLLLILIPVSIIFMDPSVTGRNMMCGLKDSIISIPTANNYKILADSKDAAILKSIKEGGVWTDNMLPLIQRLLKPGDVAIDVGSGFGYYAVMMADRVGENGVVHYLEPREDIAKIFSATKVLNGLHNIAIHNVATYSTDASILLERYKDNMQTSRIILDSKAVGAKDDVVIYNARKLDNLLHGLKDVKLLRINSMGDGLMTLEGASLIIASSPHISIMMNWDPNQIKQYSNPIAILEDMEELGFEIWSIQNGNDIRLVTRDFLMNYVGDILITKEHIE